MLVAEEGVLLEQLLNSFLHLLVLSVVAADGLFILVKLLD